MKTRGFTLIELLVVIAVLGVLAAGVFVAINPLKRINQANDAKIKSDIGQIANASQAYFVTKLSYPKTVKQLVDSDDLRTEPKQPKTDTIYTITTTPDTCDGTSANPCTDITIQVPLFAPQAEGGNYTWSTTAGQTGEIVPPTPTPTPVPDNNNPFIGDITNYSTNDCNALYTWVCDRDYPQGPLTVSIYDGPKANNILVGSGQTSFTWSGTNAAGACAVDAIYTGFSLTTPASIKNGQTHTLYYYIGDLNVNGQPGSRAEASGSEPFKCPR